LAEEFALILEHHRCNRVYAEVSAEPMEWIYGGGDKLSGLIVRREPEAAMFAAVSINLPDRSARGISCDPSHISGTLLGMFLAHPPNS
jgi:hypothetical protein